MLNQVFNRLTLALGLIALAVLFVLVFVILLVRYRLQAKSSHAASGGSGGKPAHRITGKGPGLAIGSLLLAAVLLVAGLLIYPRQQMQRYRQASSLVTSGELGQARVLYAQLGDFLDAPRQVEHLDDYTAAAALQDNGQYDDAADSFAALGRFADAADRAGWCRNRIKYDQAMATLRAGQFTEGLQQLDSLGEFLDARTQLASWQGYQKGIEQKNAGDYAPAAATFRTLGDFEDAGAQADWCADKILYDQAMALKTAGDYTGAGQQFRALGDFEDAAAQAGWCEAKPQYDQAMQLKTQGDYAAAASILATLGTFEDAAAQARWCTDKILFDKAAKLRDKGDYAAAAKIFTGLGDFEDARTQAAFCQSEASRLAYEAAWQLMQDRDYKAARAGFTDLGAYQDASELARLCQYYQQLKGDQYQQGLAALFSGSAGPFIDADSPTLLDNNNKVIYREAAQASKAKYYYKAYLLYGAIPEYRDSTAKARACIKSLPKTGVLSRSSSFSFNFVTVYFKTGDEAQFIKIYTTGKKLVLTCFVRANSKLRLTVPRGSFIIKFASGDQWFGPLDMFGDNGNYARFDEVFKPSSQYYYTFTFDVMGGNIGSEDENRTGF